MTIKPPLTPHDWRRAALVSAIVAAGSQPLPALAISFELGEIQGQFDSTVSLGSSWSTAQPDKKLLYSASSDDGRRNYRAGDAFSKLFKGTHDLELKYGDSGVFLRGNYWYDYAQRDEDQDFKNLSDNNRKASAKSAGVQMLDAFAYHNYAVAEQPGSVRLGKQVVNWGESTFIQGGINVINPVNVAALRRPGSEVKEGLVPVNMFYVSQNLSENLSAELFYQLEWDQTVIDNCGTFFSSNDYLPDGCTGLTAGADLTGNASAVRALTPLGVQLSHEGVVVPRAGDDDARDGGQWGTAWHWFVPELDTEFGAYFANYHSRLPYAGSISSPYTTNTNFASSMCGSLGVPLAGCAAFIGSATGRSLAGAARLGTSQYFADYPEDIRLYGLTFSTTLATGTALQGELSYRPNQPMQFNGVDLLQAALGDPARTPLLSSGALKLGNNLVQNGYRRKNVGQAQVTATHSFSQVMGAEQFVLIGEAGLTHVSDLEGSGGPRYGRATNYGSGRLANNTVCTSNSDTPENCDDQGFVTTNSWGYRVRAVWSYANALAGVDLKPNLSWSHDVKGYGPVETSGFNEGAKAISVGLDADLNSTYNASLSYTNYFGGDYNTRTDRDFIALSFGISF
ncbi:MAG: DUF1302 domain-containing protein [Pseudomonas sp.]